MHHLSVCCKSLTLAHSVRSLWPVRVSCLRTDWTSSQRYYIILTNAWWSRRPYTALSGHGPCMSVDSSVHQLYNSLVTDFTQRNVLVLG